jgi:tRNA threonylcarbamoyladenosine biosynthesis protein TsaB
VLTLALETSSLAGSVALLRGDQLLSQRSLPAGRSTNLLAPTIDQLLKEAGLRPADVRLVAVTVGPGSFTGLRVGATTAKAFAYAVGADVLGIDTLEAVAEQAKPRPVVGVHAELHAVLDAQRKELFLARFTWQDSALVRLDDNRIVAADAWLATLAAGTAVTGPGLDRWESRLPAGVIAVDTALRQPQAATVGRLAVERYRTGKRDDVWKLAPQYLRPSAAEEKVGQVSNLPGKP